MDLIIIPYSPLDAKLFHFGLLKLCFQLRYRHFLGKTQKIKSYFLNGRAIKRVGVIKEKIIFLKLFFLFCFYLKIIDILHIVSAILRQKKEKVPNAIKLGGGGDKALMAQSLRKGLFLRLPYTSPYFILFVSFKNVIWMKQAV